jgi:predicted secreted protein
VRIICPGKVEHMFKHPKRRLKIVFWAIFIWIVLFQAIPIKTNQLQENGDIKQNSKADPPNQFPIHIILLFYFIISQIFPFVKG